MRKAIAGIIIVLLGVGFYFSFEIRNNPPKKPKTRYEKVMFYEGIQNVDSINMLMEINNEIIMYYYGGEIIDEELKDVVVIQRNLFDEKLLEINPEVIQYERLKSEIEFLNEAGIKVIDIKEEGSKLENREDNTVTVYSKQITNTDITYNIEYTILKKEDGSYKILGWKSEPEKTSEAN